MTTEKSIVLTIWTFVSKVMSLLFNTLSRFVIAFLPRSKCPLISWVQSLSTVILKPKKIKSVTVSPSVCHEAMGPDVMILVFLNVEFEASFIGTGYDLTLQTSGTQRLLTPPFMLCGCRPLPCACSDFPADWSRIGLLCLPGTIYLHVFCIIIMLLS